MRVHTFIGKSSLEGLHQLDDAINVWLEKNPVQVRHITQTFGQERHHGQSLEPVLIVSIWFDPKA